MPPEWLIWRIWLAQQNPSPRRRRKGGEMYRLSVLYRPAVHIKAQFLSIEARFVYLDHYSRAGHIIGLLPNIRLSSVPRSTRTLPAAPRQTGQVANGLNIIVNNE